jgi:hypothetical protein
MRKTNVTQAVLDALTRAWPAPRICLICKKEGPWEVIMVGQVQEYTDGIVLPGSAIMPVVSVTCSHCANTLFFGAYKLGIIDKEARVIGHV